MAKDIATTPPRLNGASAVPDPEVQPRGKTRRRTFTAQQKLKILEETDNLPEGELGAYLRRKGLYSSALSRWRRGREQGTLAGLTPKKRGAPGKSPDAKRVAELEHDLHQLRRKLDRAEKVIEVQKKLCELFGLPPGEGEPK